MPATTNDTNRTAARALAKTPSKLPSLKALYNLSPGLLVMWKIPPIIPKSPAAIWFATIPPGLNGLNPSTPQEGETGST